MPKSSPTPARAPGQSQPSNPTSPEYIGWDDVTARVHLDLLIIVLVVVVSKALKAIRF